MRILLTGADGFTGRHFSVRAKNNGHVVCPLKSDLTNLESLKKEILSFPPDVVVHLAAVTHVAHNNSKDFYSVNVLGTANLLDALLQLNTKIHRVLIASSANVYGNCDNSPISELQHPAPINHYAMSKLAMELMAKKYLSKLPIFFTRPFNYFGPGQSELFLVPKIAAHFRARANKIELGNLNIERDFSDVAFVCDSYLTLMLHANIGEIYNICSGNVFSISTILNSFEEITGHRIQVEVNPNFVRENEVYSLHGDPSKLYGLLDRFGGTRLSNNCMQESFELMLNQYENIDACRT